MDVLLRRRLQLSRCNFKRRIITLKTSIINRIVEREILDDLPVADPHAIASRRDLQRLNVWLGHCAFVRKALRSALVDRPNPNVIEIGCGDGTFATKVLPRMPHGNITLVDRQSTVATQTLNQLAATGWKPHFAQADIFKWLPAQPLVDVIYANLFLHHFSGKQFRELLAMIAERTRVFIACEPCRSRRALVGSYILTYATCSTVTRNDAPISVRAGFAAHELSSLWPTGNWQLDERDAGIGAHLFTATKRE